MVHLGIDFPPKKKLPADLSGIAIMRNMTLELSVSVSQAKGKEDIPSFKTD